MKFVVLHIFGVLTILLVLEQKRVLLMAWCGLDSSNPH